MTEIISTTYTKENCTCYELYIDNVLSAVKIDPNSGYVLKRTFEEYGGMTTLYSSGFSVINTNSIDELFPQYEAILCTDVPEGEYISGITDSEEAI